MIRSRNSIKKNNNQNSHEGNYMAVRSNVLQQRCMQSSAESTISDALTASTASLLGHQQQEPLSTAIIHPKAAAVMPKTTSTDLPLYREQMYPEAAGYQARNTHYATAASLLAMPKENYLKLQYPDPVAQGYAAYRQARDSSPLMPTGEGKGEKQGSIRRIRRPRLFVRSTESCENTNARAIERKAGIIMKGKAFITEFLQESSIHGFIYLAKFGLSIVERMIWFAFICVALFSIISLSKRTWERFQTSPMVISMDRNKLVWNTSFPSLTVCPHKRIDELKVEEYMDLHPEHFETEQDKEGFRDFIEKLARLTYENIESLPRNNTFGIPSEKYLDILYELKWNFEPEMSSGAAVQMYIYETLTEFGICHSVNSLVARYNSYDYWKSNEWSLLDHGDRVTVHPLDGEIYAQIINLSTAYDVYFHGAGDIPNISKQRYTFPESDYTTVELIALEIYTAEEARAFTTKQRKCRFQYEAEEMRTAPIYSFGLCLAECRMFFALKICGCVPHFYRNRLNNGRVLPICGFDGFECLENIKREIISLKSSRYKIDCNCLSNCDDSNFFVQSYRSRVWFLGANLQWGIIDYPKMQLRRDVLFSFADVLVYIGGLIGFFLGCSALSFTEVVYYFTARFIRRIFFN